MNIVSFLRNDASLKPAEKKSREIIFYLVFGVLTTIVNLVTFYIFEKIFAGLDIFGFLGNSKLEQHAFTLLDQTVSWVTAIIFAFITNRIFVFDSKGPVIKEFVGFVTSRIATLIVFELGTFELWLLILENGIGIEQGAAAFSFAGLTCTYLYIVKLLNSVLVIVGNYVLSKLFVFRKRGANRSGKGIQSADGESGSNVEQ